MPVWRLCGLISATLVILCTAQGRQQRSIQSLSTETSNVLKELLSAINPVYIVVLGCLIAAGCAFELAYGSRGSSGRTTMAHVASRHAPYTVRTA